MGQEIAFNPYFHVLDGLDNNKDHSHTPILSLFGGSYELKASRPRSTPTSPVPPSARYVDLVAHRGLATTQLDTRPLGLGVSSTKEKAGKQQR